MSKHNENDEYEEYENWIDEAMAHLPSSASAGDAMAVRPVLDKFSHDYMVGGNCTCHTWYVYDMASWVDEVVDSIGGICNLGETIALRGILAQFSHI